MLRLAAAVLLGTVMINLVSCSRSDENAGVHADSPVAIDVGEENIVRVEYGEIASGPFISGELRAANTATLRAEVSGQLLEVTVREGQAVRKGAVLGRIESTSLRDARNSARSAVQSAETALSVAKIETQRTSELVSAGALAQRDLDQARAAEAAAQAQVANAKSNLASAEEQLAKTVLRAPMTGIVSARPAETGDIVNVGADLITIIDPSSMRLEASVAAEQVSALKPGTPVRFNVRGYDETFEGRIERVNPQADPITSQVPIYVTVPNTRARLVAGLFADGRIITQSGSGSVVPLNAVNLVGNQPWVLRVRDGQAERVDVTIGVRDDRTEFVQIINGVSEGDILLRGTAQGIMPGTAINISGRSSPQNRDR